MLRMRRFRLFDPPPSVRHLFAHFCAMRGVRPRPGSSIMIGLVRAAALCATLALGLNSALAADKTFKRDDLADSAIKLEAEIKKEAGPVAKTTATLKTDADAAFRRNDFRSGLDPSWQDRRHHAGGQRQLAAPGPHHLPDPRRQLDRADLPARARLDRGLHRLSARRQCGRGGGCAGRARPRHGRPKAVAAGAGCAADVARYARGRRRPRAI